MIAEDLSEGNQQRRLALWTEDGIRMLPVEHCQIGLVRLRLFRKEAGNISG